MKASAGRNSRKPKLIAGLLLLGIVVLGGGSVYAATRPTWTAPAGSASATMVTRTHRTEVRPIAAHPRAPATEVTSKAPPRPAAATASSASITYTVKPGDTLSGIAEWFKLHGYGGLYQANMAVIGADPNLIFPGQRITISHGKMSMGRTARSDGSGA